MRAGQPADGEHPRACFRGFPGVWRLARSPIGTGCWSPARRTAPPRNGRSEGESTSAYAARRQALEEPPWLTSSLPIRLAKQLPRGPSRPISYRKFRWLWPAISDKHPWRVCGTATIRHMWKTNGRDEMKRMKGRRNLLAGPQFLRNVGMPIAERNRPESVRRAVRACALPKCGMRFALKDKSKRPHASP